MSRIAVIIDEGFEDSEYQEPMKALKAAGHKIVHVGLKENAQILINAQVLEGRKITAWKSIIQDINNAGAEYLDQEVVEDGNIISSRSPQDIPAFNNRMLKKL